MIESWIKNPVTQNLLNVLTIRRVDISEALTSEVITDASMAQYNRALGTLDAIDDLLDFTFLEDMKEFKEEEE